MYRLIAATHAGPTRPRSQDNQDACRFGWINDCPALVVCDGVSASPCAAQAADLGCEVFMATLEQQPPLDQGRLAAWLNAAVLEAHTQIRRQYAAGQALCTLTAAVACPDRQEVVFINVGDSPAWFCQAGAVEMCVTKA